MEFTIIYTDHYVRIFKQNIKNYSLEISKKKNSDFRKLVHSGDSEEKKISVEIAWKIVYNT